MEKIKLTDRGFEVVEFKDRSGNDCTLQQSSLAECAKPGASAIWLGKGDHRMHLDRDQVDTLQWLLVNWLNSGSFNQEEGADEEEQ